MMHCPFCETDGGEVVWRDAQLRVVLANEPGYPGFCRVIWHAHVAEMTDLPVEGRQRVLAAVLAVEQAQRRTLAPDKVNLASLGNQVPHVHWHVIPRHVDDAHFPGSVWSESRRAVQPEVLAARTARLPALRDAIVAELEQALADGGAPPHDA